MTQKFTKALKILLAIPLVALAIIFLLKILATSLQLPSLFVILSQPVVIRVSVIALIAFIGINLLFIINVLQVSNVQRKKEQEVEESKGEFIGLMSHQLRTPLSAVNWYTESLLSGDPGVITQQQKEYIENIRESNQRMISMVNTILNISQIELNTLPFTAEPTDITKLVEDLMSELEFDFHKKGITLEKQYGADLAQVYTDPRYVRMIIENLLLNAIKYSPEKSAILISVEHKNEKLFITVTDHGYGIPKADQSKIFSKLFRAHNIVEKDTDGMGLGLSITKSVIEHAGGKISFISTEGKGSTFSVVLPARTLSH